MRRGLAHGTNWKILPGGNGAIKCDVPFNIVNQREGRLLEGSVLWAELLLRWGRCVDTLIVIRPKMLTRSML